MQDLPDKLKEKLNRRVAGHSLRTLKSTSGLIDFTSNDYLGFASYEGIASRTDDILHEFDLKLNGSTGSRLLTGNNTLFDDLEVLVALHHSADAALIFNSGFDANLGLLSCVPQRGDLILYDELAHASIREGIQLSLADSVKFRHNDLQDLQNRLKNRTKADTIYVVTESVFSMDGDQPDLQSLCDVCAENNCRLIVDEAHSIGISEKGYIVDNNLEKKVFARIVTFGKALGCHGAAVLAGRDLVTYLQNFARSFIYTTAMPPHNVASVRAAYERLRAEEGMLEIEKLKSNIALFRSELREKDLADAFIDSASAIQSIVVSGNSNARSLSRKLTEEGFDIRPILSPTVPEGKERLRICLHSFNTVREISKLILLLKKYHG